MSSALEQAIEAIDYAERTLGETRTDNSALVHATMANAYAAIAQAEALNRIANALESVTSSWKYDGNDKPTSAIRTISIDY